MKGTKRQVGSLIVLLGSVTMFTSLGSIRSNARPASRPLSSPEQCHTTKARPVENFVKLPLSFEANRRQTDPHVRFLSRGSGYTLFLTENEAVISLRGPQSSLVRRQLPATPMPGPASQVPAGVRMKLVGASQTAKVKGLEELPGKSNYFVGNEPKKWRTNVPTYAKVKYEGVYPGIDLVYYGNQRQLEYDFVVAPGADPKAITLAIAAVPALRTRVGSPALQIAANGDLVIPAGDGEVRFQKPVVYQPSTLNPRSENENRKRLDGRFVLEGNRRVGFEVAAYDRTRPLVIDPVLDSTYLGGGSEDRGQRLAVDSSGNAYVTGRTASVDFPTSNALQNTYGGGTFLGDAFVSKINAAGTALVYSTYLGGNMNEDGLDIAVDASGNAYVTGVTGSTNFPHTSGVYQASFGGGVYDAFVTKLNAAGSAMVYSTYLGDVTSDEGDGIAVDGSGNAYVAGTTAFFPTTGGAFQTNEAGFGDAFVAKLNAAGSALVYATYLGGSNDEGSRGIAVDGSGNAYVTGLTSSSDFPTANNAPQTTFGGVGAGFYGDAFVTKLNAAGSALVYSTFLGGSDDEVGGAIAVDNSGNAYVTGYTLSSDFPAANALQGDSDAFVTKLNSSGSAFVYSKYLGGSDDDGGGAIAVDGLGNAYVTGGTYSTDFPKANAVQSTYGGNGDAFVTKIKPDGSALLYSTYLGGSDLEGGDGIAVHCSGNLCEAYVTGSTVSTDFPHSSGAYQASYGGGAADAFVARISLNPDFALSPIAPINAVVGGSGSSAIDVRSLDEFDAAVTLSASGGPSGVSTSFGINPVTPPVNDSAFSTLTVNLGLSVTPGAFTLKVTGTSGALTHSAPANVKVTATSSSITTVIGALQAAGCIDKSGISGSLTSKLAAVQAYIDAGDIQDAINTLIAVLNQLQAQGGKHINTSCTVDGVTFDPVVVLINDVQALMASL